MGNFVVSARKYRPKTFDEVIGQDHVARTLKNALQSDHLAHSFLFTGPRGVGKTTCARILAKVINCENPISKVEPCNTCSSCNSFNDNASFNIIELDAASNNSVDHMRSLIEQVRFQPQHGTYKVFIIDEVHMLSSQAFNAFLKTLEEPPSYAIFILATTEKHKILPTILSRCQIFDFKRIQPSEVVSQLEYILKEENKTAEQEALHLIGQKADGAMRDALSIYDKISSSTGKNITYKDVITNLNILDYEYYFKVIDAFLREDMSEVLIIVDEIIRQGFEVDQFVQGLGNHMRDLLVCKDERTLSLLDVSDKLKQRYVDQARLSNRSQLLSGMDILNQCDVSLPRSTNKRLYTEIALSKINYIKHAVPVNISTGEKKNPIIKKKAIPQESKTKESITEVEAPSPIVNKEVRPTSPDPKVGADADDKKDQAPQKPEKYKKIIKPIAESDPNAKSSDKPIKKALLVDLDISSIVDEIKEDDARKNKAKQNLSIEGIHKIWNRYMDETKSPSVSSALKNCEITLEANIINVYVPNQIAQNIITEEADLLETLRDELGSYDLIMKYFIDKEKFPESEESKPKAMMTDKERFHSMVEKNKDLLQFVNMLGLKKLNDNL